MITEERSSYWQEGIGKVYNKACKVLPSHESDYTDVVLFIRVMTRETLFSIMEDSGELSHS
jgi:hypothetical protein